MKLKIKIVDLDKISRIQKRYSDAYGVFVPETNTIYIDHKLSSNAIPSKQTVLKHEMAHAILHKAGITLESKQEESLCWLYALATSPESGLTHTEVQARMALFGKLSWSRKSDRIAMIHIIMDTCLRGLDKNNRFNIQEAFTRK